MNMYIPIIVVVLSNTFYHICAKSAPERQNTFASLSVTYAVGAVLSVIMYFITQRGGNFAAEYRNLNWTSFVLGISIVGLEAGFLYMYKAGWDIGVGQLISSAVLSVVLIFVGFFLYREAITPTKLIGIALCMAGLYFINK